MWTTLTQTLLVLATFPSEDPKCWQRPPIQTTSESPEDVALGAALRCCSARHHGTALSHLDSPGDATQKSVVLSGEGSTALVFFWVGNAKERFLSIHTWKYFSTNGSVFAYPSFSPRHEPLTLSGGMCQPPGWSQDRHCLGSSRPCCWVQPTMSSFTFACCGPGPRGLPKPAQGDL